jgi:hypothetical protein
MVENRDLQERMNHLERELLAVRAELARRSDPADGRVAVGDAGRAPVDRRHLLRTAATGAVAGGAALVFGGTERADAASGTFDGAPAVSAQGVDGYSIFATRTQTPAGGALPDDEFSCLILASTPLTHGRGVTGIAQSGVGIEGHGPVGVKGFGNGTGGVGVLGASEAGEGVRGSVQTLQGVGVRGVNNAGGTAVRAEAYSLGVHATASASDGVAVKGESSTGIGILGESPLGPAVVGRTTNAVTNGVRGENTGQFGTAVEGNAPKGYGVTGTGWTGGEFVGSTLYGVWAEVASPAARAQVALRAADGMPAPPDRTDSHGPGEIYLDSANGLWCSVADGSPGTWRQLAGLDTAGSLHLITPKRVYDSRPTDPPLGGVKGPLGNGTRDVDCTNNASGVPLGATAVLVNLTVVNTSASGFLAAYKKGIAFPGTSSINWNLPTTIVANTTIVAVDAAAKLTCLVPVNASADFFVDVIGYFR